MPNYRFDLIQDSPEWLAARLGIPTASEFDRILTPAKLQLASASKGYMAEKLAEWMAGEPLADFEDQPPIRGWRERGKLLEAEAVRYYEMESDCECTAVGFVTIDDGNAGASPDRLVGELGLLEQKCPALTTHVGYMLDPGSLLADYRMQVQGELWVCRDRSWCDVQSYYPGFPSVIHRATRDEAVSAALDAHIPAFCETLARSKALLIERYGELRRERLADVKAAAVLEARRAAFDSWMASPIGGNV